MRDEYEELRRNGFPELRRPRTEDERAHQHDLWLRMRYGPAPRGWLDRHDRAGSLILVIGLYSFFAVELAIASYGQDDPADARPFLLMIGVAAVYALVVAVSCWMETRGERRWRSLAEWRASVDDMPAHSVRTQNRQSLDDC